MDAAAHTKSLRLIILARDIKLSHSIFALPFALLAAYLAASDGGHILHRDWKTLLLILVCMILARTVAMTVNRLADSRLDAQNPRTAEPLRMTPTKPSGRLALSCRRPCSSTGINCPGHCTISPLTRIHNSSG